MKTIQDLLQERVTLVEAQAALLNVAQAADRTLTAEEDARFEALETDIKAKDTEIGTMEKHQARVDRVDSRVKDLDKPVNEPRRPNIQVGADRAGKKPWVNFGEQMMAVYMAAVPNGKTDPRLYQMQAAATGLGGAVPSDGGFLVHTDFAENLLERTYESGILASRVERLPLSEMSDGIKIPAVDETSRADGSRWGGIRAYWADEGDEKTATKPKFRLVDLKLKKLIGLAYATDELLKDHSALGSWLTRAFSQEFAFKIDDMIYRGNGVGKGLGLLNAPALVTVAAETNQAATTILFENVKKMWSRCYGRSRQNAVWFVNQDVEPQLYGMSMTVGTGGVPVYLPAGGISGQPFGTLFGRPVIPIEHADTVGTVGDIVLVDLSQYLMIDKENIESAVSIHVRFIYDESAFRFVYRVDGAPWWNSALTPFKGTNTQSPFVALASR